jgi:hypothetical protein
LYVRNEQYHGENYDTLQEVAVRFAWRSGENYYWEDQRGTRMLGYEGEYWGIRPPKHSYWKQYSNPEYSYTTWNNYEAEEFLTGEVAIWREGGNIILEQKRDYGTDNCSLSRQIATYTFYMETSGEIVRYTSELITYKGKEVNPKEISGISKSEYYITPIDAEEATEIVREQYESIKK